MTKNSFIFNKIKLLITNIYYCFTSIFYFRDKSIVLVGSWFGERFADNSRFIFQYLSKNKDIHGLKHVVWVTRNIKINEELNNLGYESYIIGSKESNYFHKKAYYHIVCNAGSDGEKVKGDVDGKYSFGAKRINLWHATMWIKGITYSSKEYIKKYNRFKNNNPKLLVKIDWLVRHSKIYRKVFKLLGGWDYCKYFVYSINSLPLYKNSFELPDDCYVLSTSPRYLGFDKYLNKELEIISKIKSYNKCILYAPTFRNNDSLFDFNSFYSIVKDYIKDKNIVLLQKQHSASNSGFKTEVDNNVINLENDFDLNVLINQLNLVVTDYSSIAIDALVYNVPVINYVPDYMNYMEEDRGFVIDTKDFFVNEPFINNNNNSLIKYIDTVLYNPDFNTKTDSYISLKNKYCIINKDYYGVWQDIVKG